VSILKQLVAFDVVHAIKAEMREQGFYIDPNTGQYTGTVGVDPDRPWIYTVPNYDLYCGHYMRIFNNCNFVPRRCMECWKICVFPRTVHELMQLYQCQEQVAKPKKWFCKCGIDLREHTPHRYGGYFYARGEKEGRKRWVMVRKMVDENVGEDVPVILKRYCTEFELKLGPTDKYERPAHADELEDYIDHVIDYKKMKTASQPMWVKNHVMRRWLTYAWSIGDMTCLAYNKNEPFYPTLVTYHDQMLEDLRKGVEPNAVQSS
jgi:hypothetical protein